ncbi:MAG: ferritin family protein [Pseudomonadota bacterium]
MNIYKYAMKMEKDGEKYYRELAKKTEDLGLQNILKMLADEEVKHYHIIEQISRKDKDAEVTETEILKNAKNIFIEMKKEGLKLKPNTPQTKLYRKALEIEKKSCEFYLDKSNTVEIESQKKIFFKLAEEEKKHMFLMENIVEFVSRPETWIEDAEFNHLDEY